MKTKRTQKSISLLVVLATILSCFTFLALPVSAASIPFPSISQNKYIETIAEVDMPIFRNMGLTTRGTSYPGKSYNAYIDAGDTVRIIGICNNKAIILQYPTASGWRTGYASFANFFNYSPNEKFVATVTATVRAVPYGAVYGTITSGDTVYRVGESNGHILVIYQAKSGNRGYKLGYILESDYQKIKKQNNGAQTVSSTKSAAYNTLTKMKNGTTYNGVYKVNTVYRGPYKNEQCKGFAKSVFEQLYGYNIGSTCSKAAGVNYKININTSKTTCLGSVTQMTSNTASQNNIKNLFLKASAGDFVQMRRQHGGSHSAIVYTVTEKGVTFYEANIDGKNGIVLKTYTWYDLCKANSAMSIYRDK